LNIISNIPVNGTNALRGKANFVRSTVLSGLVSDTPSSTLVRVLIPNANGGQPMSKIDWRFLVAVIVATLVLALVLYSM
jgi:hypothetical protein